MDLAPHLAGLLSALGPAARRALARDVARELRAAQVRRIAAQRNPDGSGFEPRRPRLRAKSGRIRRAMFARLRTTRHLRTESSADAALVVIAGRAARIARVHQYGLTDRVSPRGPRHRYAARELLGFTDADRQSIADRVLDHLARRTL